MGDSRQNRKENSWTAESLREMKGFLILWSTQSISQLGSSITAFALTLWLYEKTGSSLNTAALMMFLLGVAGVLLCLVNGARLKKYHYSEN